MQKLEIQDQILAFFKNNVLLLDGCFLQVKATVNYDLKKKKACTYSLELPQKVQNFITFYGKGVGIFTFHRTQEHHN